MLKVKRMPGGEGLPLPERATSRSSGIDLRAAVSLLLEPGARAAVPTGFAVVIPEGFEGQVRPRSGLALRHGITVLNSPGTIDADYRGEVQVILVNLGSVPFDVVRGDRIAQLVIAPVSLMLAVAFDDELPVSGRGAGGFGSTGR